MKPEKKGKDTKTSVILIDSDGHTRLFSGVESGSVDTTPDFIRFCQIISEDCITTQSSLPYILQFVDKV